jgi:predicted glycoside hydrolase/deacetylase ChbG (UPF0249 family)
MTAPPVRIRLVTRGDDAGSCPSANLAVLDAFRSGILRNASVLVPGPAFDEAARMFSGLEALCIGLHVTLNAEWDAPKWGPVLPASRVPSLVDDHGHFLQNPMLLHERNADPDQMIAEVQAQLDLARAKGLEVAYIDEHMGVGWLPGLGQRLSDLARREGLVESRAVVSGLPDVDGQFADAAERLIARLEAAPPGTYLIVTHPGYNADDMRRLTHKGLAPGQVAIERDADRRMYTDRRVLAYCKARGVMPIRYTEIQRV